MNEEEIKTNIINLYDSNPNYYLSATTCRKLIVGDSGLIISLHIELDKNGLINYSILNPALKRDKERIIFLGPSNSNNNNTKTSIIKRKNDENLVLVDQLTHLSDLNENDVKIYKNVVKKTKIDDVDNNNDSIEINSNKISTNELNKFNDSNDHKLENLNRLKKFEEFVINSAENTIGIDLKNKIINNISNNKEIYNYNDINNNTASSLCSSILAISQSANNQINKEEDKLDTLVNDYLQIRYKGLLEKVRYIYKLFILFV
jgi:hypothetical protein